MSQMETPQESPVPGAVASRRAPALRGREPCAPRPLCGLCSRTHGLVSDVATEPPRPRAVWGGRRTLQGGSLTACYVPPSGLGRFAARPVGEVARPGGSWRSRGPARGRGAGGGPWPRGSHVSTSGERGTRQSEGPEDTLAAEVQQGWGTYCPAAPAAHLSLSPPPRPPTPVPTALSWVLPAETRLGGGRPWWGTRLSRATSHQSLGPRAQRAEAARESRLEPRPPPHGTLWGHSAPTPVPGL